MLFLLVQHTQHWGKITEFFLWFCACECKMKGHFSSSLKRFFFIECIYTFGREIDPTTKNQNISASSQSVKTMSQNSCVTFWRRHRHFSQSAYLASPLICHLRSSLGHLLWLLGFLQPKLPMCVILVRTLWVATMTANWSLVRAALGSSRQDDFSTAEWLHGDTGGSRGGGTNDDDALPPPPPKK